MGFNLLHHQLIQAGTRRRKSFVILGEPHPYDPDTYYVVDYDTEGHKIVWTKDVLSSLIIRGYAKEVFDQVKELSRVKVRLIEV